MDWDYPQWFGDKTSYESLIWLDFLIPGLLVITFSWNAWLGPVWWPFITGDTAGFPGLNLLWYLCYK